MSQERDPRTGAPASLRTEAVPESSSGMPVGLPTQTGGHTNGYKNSSAAASSASSMEANRSHRPSTFQRWRRRFSVLLFVLVCAIAGMLLVILPWRPEWTDNHLLMASPSLRAFVANGFVRGLCSGLGLLDIWLGLSEAVYYHEEA